LLNLNTETWVAILPFDFLALTPSSFLSVVKQQEKSCRQQEFEVDYNT